MGRNQEKDLFREFMEDFNTGTLDSEKYVDIEKWKIKEKEKQAGNAIQTAVNNDEELMRREKIKNKLEQASKDEFVRLEIMKKALMEAKKKNTEEWKEIQKRNEMMKEAPTFESIAKQREIEKKINENRQKYR